MNRLSGKVAVITGAGAGIGRATAELFAEEGAAVVIAERDEATGQDAAARIKHSGGKALFVRTDVADESSVAKMAAEAVAAFGAIHTLVNNAAIFILRGIEATPEEWRQMLDVNVMGPAWSPSTSFRRSRRPAAVRSSTWPRSPRSSPSRIMSRTTRPRRPSSA